MSRTYDLGALAPTIPTSLDWALSTCRRYLRDTPNEVGAFAPRSFLDAELEAQLRVDAATVGTTTYYRPHVSASVLLKANPERVLAFSGGGYSESYESAEKLARSILQAGSGIDDAINALAGAPIVSTARVARVVF